MLGASRMVTLPSNILTIATGNNLRVAGDMVRRVLPIEMDAKVEHPELRTFNRELVPWAIDNRQNACRGRAWDPLRLSTCRITSA